MGWGPDPIWSAANVLSVESACPSQKSVLVRLSVPAETAASYTVPGQYVQVRPNDDTKPAFLAICSPPLANTTTSDKENTASTFDFLIKKTDSNDWLTKAGTVGTAIQVSQVLGNGYATAENLDSLKYDFPTQNVLLFAAGSGIAPIAAAIEAGLWSGRNNADYSIGSGSRTCRLYYGERTADDLCLVERFAAWEKMGVEVVPVLSQPEGGVDEWKGRTGYIQTALAEDGIAIPRNTGALLCGMKGMTESVKELLMASGVFEGRILFNF
jgi:NAD(P)H-flavin reductase